ncbi:MAG: S8/S53 family peptidase, partial [Clostridia bacterium]|nr:S8/S53 family peptidase [Clostridia bacterium]
MPSGGIAQADEIDWESVYIDYISSLDEDDLGEWYFDENNLNIEGVRDIINEFLASESFDKESLKADPIIIAVIDSGIGYAYTTDGAVEYSVSSENVYDEGVQYKLHPIFDDVLLKDANGDYVFKSVATEVNIKYNGNVINTITAAESGNIAQDLVDNTSNDHGTHVTGMVAMLIHKLGLEDYIKILPIKANVTLEKEVKNGKTNYYAGYQIDTLEEAMDFCLENGVDIVNMSLTAYKNGLLGSIDEGYKFEKYSDDMLIVASAGNKGTDTMGYPACVSNVLGVMNYCLDGNGRAMLADSSNYGSWYDIAVPGTGIISSINGDEYGKLSGTSMATPIATFASALAYFRYRGYNNYNRSYDLSIQSIRTMVSYEAHDATYVDDGLYAYPILSMAEVLSYNYYGDYGFLLAIGVEPDDVEIEGINIIGNIAPEYKIGECNNIFLYIQTIPMEATIDETIYWWQEHNDEKVKIGQGRMLDYTIPNNVGAYKIYCTVDDENSDSYIISDNTIEFTVIPMKANELSILCDGYVPEEDRTYYTFYVNTEYLDTTSTAEVIWYLNGEKVAEGREFQFAPPEDGVYVIKATVNGEPLEEVNFNARGGQEVCLNGDIFLITALLATGSAMYGAYIIGIIYLVILGLSL